MTRAKLLVVGCAAAIAAAGLTGTAQAGPNKKKSNTWSWSSGPGNSVHVSVLAGRGRLGLSVLNISPAVRQSLGAPSGQGVLVNEVRSGSPADKAGIVAGDILISVGGQAVDSATEILGAMSGRKKGDKVAVEVVRNRKKSVVKATLEDDGMGIDFGKDFNFDFDFDAHAGGPDAWVPKNLHKVFPFASGQTADAKIEKLMDRIDELEKRLNKMSKSKSGRKPAKKPNK